ncbi:hypothetical protein ABZ078_25430 [Streptomyces sp. NPDC006385]|uniref:hypothetical protein n=1 Tax=Streptomyces sp. NPDC006385 TaxID=3156761 RepID=UPI0033A34FF4
MTKTSRIWGVPLILSSLVAALLCWLVFTTWLPSQVERYREYAAAEPCASERAAQRWEDCLRTVSLTVEHTVVEKRKRNSEYEAYLTSAPFWNHEVSFGGPEPVLERLRQGDRVAGTVWRGDIMAVAQGGLRQSTSEEPRDDAQMTACLGVLAGLLAALGLGFGARQSAGLAGRGPFTWRRFGKPVFITLLIVGFAVGFLALWLDLPWWVVPPVTGSLVVWAAWLLHRHRGGSTDPLRPVLDAP